MNKWKNKIREKYKKKVDPEISRGAHKLARTPQLLKKIVKKNNQLIEISIKNYIEMLWINKIYFKYSDNLILRHRSK